MKNIKHCIALFVIVVLAFGFASCKHDSTPETIVDLSGATGDVVIKDGVTVKGTLSNNVKVSIEEGATVTFDGLSINADGNWTVGSYAGLTCIGDATIILKDDSTNTVKGFYGGNPGIYIPENKTLTIKGETAGTGALVASGAKDGYGAGIGGGMNGPNGVNCGNIEIQGGVITATGTLGSPGIGSGREASCGTITISGGTITATGGAQAAAIGTGNAGTCGDITISGGIVSAESVSYSAAIGGGHKSTCGTITIANTVTRVSATKGAVAAYSIGKGADTSTCGTITIGGEVVADGIAESPYVYAPVNYREGSWNETAEAVDFATKAAGCTEIANDFSGAITSGWYAVTGSNVVIDGDVALAGDTNIILCDGAKLTVNGNVSAQEDAETHKPVVKLNIYSQDDDNGKGILNINGSEAIKHVLLSVHGGTVTATGTGNYGRGINYCSVNVYGGSIKALTNGISACGMMGTDYLNVYGGSFEANGNGTSVYDNAIVIANGLVTVYGGKLVAGNANNNAIGYDNCKIKSGTSKVKFYTSQDGTTWDAGTVYLEATTRPSAKYIKAE